MGAVSGHGCRLGIVDPTPQRLATARKIVAAGAAWRGGRDIWFSPRPMLAGGEGGIAFVFPGLEVEVSPAWTTWPPTSAWRHPGRARRTSRAAWPGWYMWDSFCTKSWDASA